MTTLAPAAPVARSRSEAPAHATPQRELALRLVAFGALCAFCAGHYSVLVAPSPAGRVALVVIAATAGGATLALTERMPGGRLVTLSVRLLIALGIAVAAFAATGLHVRLLFPGNWGSLNNGLQRGFAGLDSFDWPYAGPDTWIRLTILLGMPLLVAPAAVLAFWPARRMAGLLRTGALVLLLVLYGTGVTERGLGGWELRGLALLALVAAWLWLPKLSARNALPAAIGVLVCGGLAIPVSSTLDASQAWFNYRNWNLAPTRNGTSQFNWDQTYGPIQWRRDGRTVLEIQAPQAHYWKAETLERFDGLRWVHSQASIEGGSASQDVVQPNNRAWNERITVSVQHLSSSLVIGAGTTYQVNTDKPVIGDPDGTIQVLGDSFNEGDGYTVRAYVPDPTAAQMRAASPVFPARLLGYTNFELPSPDQSGLHPQTDSEAGSLDLVTTQTVGAAVPGQGLPPAARRRVLGSPYGSTYRLARRLAAGQPTTYDTVSRVERYFQNGFAYSEQPPRHRYPLPAFLFHDRVGYCQQFSGAMALLLRMDGIPARVAAGFAPGQLDSGVGAYLVRDFDAHSWVEVWFDGIGWVPFDPTPTTAPATAQSNPKLDASAARGSSSDPGAGAPLKTDPGGGSFGKGGGAKASSSRLALVVAVLGGLVVLALASMWIVRVVRFRRRFPDEVDAAVYELRRALDRLGYASPPGTTLAQIERRVRRLGGDTAARYVASLGRLRYGRPADAPALTAHDRRALRGALTAHRGPLARLQGLVVLPPRLGLPL